MSFSQENSEILQVEPLTPSGCVFAVKVAPGAKRNAVGGLHQGELKVSVTQVAENGKANPQVIKVLAEFLKIRKSQLELISGETSRHKKIACHSLTPQELQAKIKADFTSP